MEIILLQSLNLLDPCNKRFLHLYQSNCAAESATLFIMNEFIVLTPNIL